MIRILPTGDGGITFEFDSEINCATSLRVFALFERLRAAPPPGFIAALPTFRSLTVQFDPILTNGDLISAVVLACVAEPGETLHAPASRWRIPVCYDDRFAPDLEMLAVRVGRPADALAQLHASQVYRVYMLGGFPGFAFMGDLPEALQAPRLASPRLGVPAGSVAVAGRITAVYPAATPGGWNLIGRTPVRLFDPAWRRPALMGPGDEVEFYRIDAQAFRIVEERVAADDFDPIELRVQ